MSEFWPNTLYPLVRWLHLVCSTLIVGGTLFFELVLPIALEDLKNEQRFYAFARARLVFRWVVWISVAGILLSGGVTGYRMWATYRTPEFFGVSLWGMAHVAVGLIAITIALLLTIGSRPPENPVAWMRINIVILLVVIFIGSATQHFHVAVQEREHKAGKVPAATPASTRP
ncbi:MAG: hypothetical protein ABSH20_20900 [Tepidisphaeraceae bacterium]|jgi:uncharacterized membrane protein